MRRPIGVVGSVAVVLLLAACARGASPSGVPPASASAVPSSSPSISAASLDASASPGPARHEPGRPYSADSVLELMASSRRPGGVPGELQQPAIAGAVADELWTYDGSAWDTASAGGSCGPSHCTLEIGGSSAGTVGEDLYIFDVTLDSGAVSVLSAELRGMPQAAADGLDAWAREHWPDAPLPGPMASARWLPPPDTGGYVLSYRSGGEENSPAIDAIVDVEAGTITLEAPG